MSDTAVQSVDRAARILELLAARSPRTVTEVAAELEVHKSTASRLLASLAAHALVEAVPGARGGFRLGPALVRLASTVSARPDFSQVAQALCDRTGADLELTANVAILDGIHAVNVSQALGGHGLWAPRHYIGQRTPGHATSSGKCLLAHSGDEVVEAAIAAGLERWTARTITDADALRAELDPVREQGWAAVDQEWEESITAVSIPLFDAAGALEGALSVTGPVHALRPERFAATAERMRGLLDATGRWRAARG